MIKIGQHKYNPVAQQAKEGLIEPKKKSQLSKREMDRRLFNMISEKTGHSKLIEAMGIENVY